VQTFQPQPVQVVQPQPVQVSQQNLEQLIQGDIEKIDAENRLLSKPKITIKAKHK
jgi:hypothetical protein